MDLIFNFMPLLCNTGSAVFFLSYYVIIVSTEPM